jgi:glucose-6-phosphate dehydrogenase assembly protein OpcA
MIRLEDTSGGEVAAAIAAERHRMGSPVTGMVLTLLILSDEEAQADATSAAVAAARQHPMRIVTLIPRAASKPSRIDAEVAVGGDDGPGEVAVIRLRGDRAAHANSVAIPLLLSDTPVIAYWPHESPDVPEDDPIGFHAQRRITDAAMATDPIKELRRRRDGYRPGDTDLAWTRLTPWRTILSSMLDLRHGELSGASVRAEDGSPSALLLTLWLGHALKVPAVLVNGEGPGINEVRLTTDQGDLVVARDQAASGHLSRPGFPDARISIPRRELSELISEELRRLDPDDLYGHIIALVPDA